MRAVRGARRGGADDQVGRPRPLGHDGAEPQHLVPAAGGPDDIDRAVHWVLARPDIFLNTVGDLDLLPTVLDAASRFEDSPGDVAMRRVVEQRHATTLFGIGT